MKPRLLKIIVCPHCKEKLSATSFQTQEEEIVSGILNCKCGRKYPIIKGVPRLLPDSLKEQVIKNTYPEFFEEYENLLKEYTQKISENTKITNLKKKTLRGFGYEWKKFDTLFKEYEQQFLNWIKPVQPEFFKNKLVLDAGCGTGRHIYCSNKFGAETIGIDLSEAVDAAQKNTGSNKNTHIIQADIFNLPFKENTFDYTYCIGVLHHLPTPEKGFRALISVLKKNAAISIWVYGKERNYTLKILNPLRKYLFSKMPLALTKLCALAITLAVYPTAKLFYKPLSNMDPPKILTKMLPQWHFFNYIANFNLRIAHSIIFDQLLAPVAFYHTKEEVQKWFEDNKIQNTIISARNFNSWRGFGIKK